jgi:UDP-N-acetyl-D-mannosaminuronic acid dehydrogenase
MLDVVIVGCGTIGTAIGAALAAHGVKVGYYDDDPCRQQELLAFQFNFEEQELIAASLQTKSIQVLTYLGEFSANNYIICVPTPVNIYGDLETTHLDLALFNIFKIAKPDTGIFIRSTLSIGATRKYANEACIQGKSFLFACTPDRSIEGRSFIDQTHIPQLVGALTPTALQRASDLFSRLGECINLGSPEAAEAAKLFTNTWRASVFAISNSMALLCEDHDLDIHKIFDAASKSYPRFTPALPGFVGGPCLPKDIRILKGSTSKNSRALLQGIMDSESTVLNSIIDKLDKHLNQFENPEIKILLAGVAFKGNPEVDDTRGSLALLLLEHFKHRWPKSSITGWDLAVKKEKLRTYGMLVADDIVSAVKDSVLIIFCNNHEIFSTFDLSELARLASKGALFYDVYGACGTQKLSLPNNALHHIFGCGSFGVKNV